MKGLLEWLDSHGGWRRWLAAACAVLLLGGCFWQSHGLPDMGGANPARMPVSAENAKLIDTSDAGGSLESSEPQEVVVHVSGAVAHPGVYTLSGRARVNDAIAAAGGALPEADTEALNLAQRLTDGTKIVVPRQGEGAPPATAPGTISAADPAGGRISLNTASLEDLQKLSGIGPAKAQAIVAYREAHNGFRSVEELKQVSGIGEKTYDRLAADIQL